MSRGIGKTMKEILERLNGKTQYGVDISLTAQELAEQIWETPTHNQLRGVRAALDALDQRDMIKPRDIYGENGAYVWVISKRGHELWEQRRIGALPENVVRLKKPESSNRKTT